MDKFHGATSRGSGPVVREVSCAFAVGAVLFVTAGAVAQQRAAVPGCESRRDNAAGLAAAFAVDVGTSSHGSRAVLCARVTRDPRGPSDDLRRAPSVGACGGRAPVRCELARSAAAGLIAQPAPAPPPDGSRVSYRRGDVRGVMYAERARSGSRQGFHLVEAALAVPARALTIAVRTFGLAPKLVGGRRLRFSGATATPVLSYRRA